MPVIAKLTRSDGPRRPHRRRLRTIQTLPTLLTLGNLVCGIASIHFCMSAIVDAEAGRTALDRATLNSLLVERFLPSFLSVSAFMIILGMLFDMVDGRVARFTNRTSNFGGQLDSLADMVTFGVAPAVLMITLLTRLPDADLVGLPGRAVWVVAAIYASCTAMRLARFNVEHADGRGKAHATFHGLPSPGAAMVVASLVLLHEMLASGDSIQPWRQTGTVFLANVMPYVLLACSLMMVGNLRFVHLGNTYLRGRRPFEQVVVFVIVLGIFLYQPILALVAGSCAYAASGPIAALIRWMRGRPASPLTSSRDGARSTDAASHSDGTG